MKLIVDIPQEYYDDIQKNIPPSSGIDSDDIMFHILKSGIPYEEAQHGEWIPVDTVETHYYCKSCGGSGDSWDKFCRHCGADMRRKE